jgi:O-antigen ligase
MNPIRALLQPPTALILAVLSGWMGVASLESPGTPARGVLLALAAAGTFAVTRLLPRPLNLLVPTSVVAAAAAIVAADPVDTFGKGPLRGVFGYGNAKGQFFALAALAAVMILVGAANPVVRAIALAASGGFLAVPILSGSLAAAGLALVWGALAALSPPPAGSRAAVAIMLVAFVGAVGGTSLIGASATEPPRAVARALGERRLDLWRDAGDLIRREPLTGVGAGRFPIESPTAASDRDTRWTHNGFLEMAAETGLAGGVLLAGVFVWALASALAPGADRTMAAGAAVVATLGMHATVDYVLRFPWIVITAAALAGSALGGRPRLRQFTKHVAMPARHP